MRAVYLHGFASSHASRKGQWLRERWGGRGVELETPDLNIPSFAQLQMSAILAHLDGLYGRGERVFLVGSSMGGYLAARWCELHPERVGAAVLLCPGFDMERRWQAALGASFEQWEKTGAIEFGDAWGQGVAVGWGLLEDARRHPPYPRPRVPTTIIHGVRDQVVPVEVSRGYRRDWPEVDLVEVDDDHLLLANLERIDQVAWERWQQVVAAAPGH